MHNTDTMSPSSSSSSAPVAVSDFAMTALANSTVLFVGGKDASGEMVKLDRLTAWSDEQDWYTLGLLGEIPQSRVGATLTPHPTLKDLIILHGGAVQEGSSTSATASVSFLNLTTLSWSAPSHVQPARHDARAWHSDIITPSGVLVSAFGLGAGNNPHSEVNYLDMRDSNANNWNWKRIWTEDMLDPLPGSGSGSTSTNSGSNAGAAANVKVPATSNNITDTESKEDDGSLKQILPPTLIIGLVLLGLFVWLARRQVKVVRRRRLARHFEIDNTHDEEGNTTSSNIFDPVSKFLVKRGWTQSSSFAGLPRPFGGVRIPDSDETETRAGPGWHPSLIGVFSKFAGRGESQARPAQEMRQVDGRRASRTQWEEIDFGLGRVDEQRRSSVGPSRPETPRRSEDQPSRQILAREFNKNRSRVSFPPDNGPIDSEYLPSLVVVPPSNPSTPYGENRLEDPFASYPVMAPSSRTHGTIAEQPEAGAEWDQLEREIETAQPFRRSGTISSTNSSVSATSKEVEPLPRMSFEEKPATDFSHGLSSYGIGLGQPITRRASSNDGTGNAFAGRSVSSPSPQTPPRDHTAAATIGYSPGYVRDLISGHAQSPARIPRSGELSRSATMNERPHSSVNLFNKYQATESDSQLSLADYRMDAAPVRVQRLSNPPRFPPPTSPLPQAPATGVSRRVSTSDAAERSITPVGTLARPIGEARQLRVVNATPRPDEVDEFGGKA